MSIEKRLGVEEDYTLGYEEKDFLKGFKFSAITVIFPSI